MKSWEEMSYRERAEQTIRDLKRRQDRRKELKRIADYEAKIFTIESSLKHSKRIRGAKTRGCRSF